MTNNEKDLSDKSVSMNREIKFKSIIRNNKDTIYNFIKRIGHYLGLHKGNPETFYDNDGRLYVCFLCECGKRCGVTNIDGYIDSILKTKIE